MAWFKCGSGSGGGGDYNIYTIATNQVLDDMGGTKTYQVSGFDYSQVTSSNFKAVWVEVKTGGGSTYWTGPTFSFNNQTGVLSLSWGTMGGSSTMTIDIWCVIEV